MSTQWCQQPITLQTKVIQRSMYKQEMKDIITLLRKVASLRDASKFEP